MKRIFFILIMIFAMGGKVAIGQCDPPTVGTITTPAPFCSGNSMNPTTPTINPNGNPITSQSWQIETSVSSNIYTNITTPYTLSVSDNNKKIRYRATNSCGDGFSNTVTITVNPIASIGNKPTTICSGTAFSVTPTNGGSDIVPAGTVYTWTVNSNSNITGASNQSSPQSSISQTLTNTSNTAQTIVYTVTPLSGGCAGATFTVTVTVSPKPSIGNKPATICSGTAFTVTPTNGGGDIVPAGTTYTWTVGSNSNITGASNQNTSQTSISQTLTNTSNIAQTIVYTVSPLSGSCPGATFTITVMVNPKPSIGNKPVTICSGTAFTVAPTNGSGDIVPTGTTYTWTVGSNSNITGASNQSSPQSSISQTLTNTSNIAQTIVYTVTPISGSCPGATFTVTVMVNPKPSISNKPATICSGTAFSVTPTNGSGDIVPTGTTYTWTIGSNSNITGASAQSSPQTTISQTLTNTSNTAQNMTYTVTPLSGSCPGSTFTITVTVNPKPSISNKPTTTCSGTAFTVAPTNGVGGDIVPSNTTYTWTVGSNSNITGASNQSSPQTNISQTLTNTSNIAQNITYTVTPLSGSCPGSTFTITVTVNPKPSIGNKTTTICSGGTFSVTPTNGGGDLVPTNTTYTWTVSSNSNITGASNQSSAQTSISQTLTNTSSSIQTITYTVTPLSGSCPGSTFTITVTVNPLPTAFTQPSNETKCPGETVTVNFTGTGIAPAQCTWTNTNPNIGLLASGTGNISFTATNTTASAISAIITVTPVSPEGCPAPALNKVFTITINSRPTAFTQPNNETKCPGETVTVNFTGTGIDPSQCTWTNTNPNIGLDPSGTNNISFTTTNTTASAIAAAITVTPVSPAGCSAPALNRTFTITVNPRPTAFTQPNDEAKCPGETVTVNFTGSGIEPSKCTWTNNNPNIGLGTSGMGNINFTATNTTANAITANITVTPVSSAGCSAPALNRSFSVTVYAPFDFSLQPEGETMCDGSNPNPKTLKVEVTGGVTPYKYEWKQSPDGTSNWIPAVGGSGSNTASYTPPPLSLNSTIYYRCDVSSSASGCGTIESKAVKVTNTSLKIDSVSHTQQTICYGDPPATLYIVVATAPNLECHWEQRLDGTSIWEKAEGSGPTTIYSPPKLTHTTYYRCYVTSDCGNDTSPPIRINVLENFKVIAISDDTSICYDELPDPITVEATGGETPYKYEWEQSHTGTSSWIPVVGGSGDTTATYSPPKLNITTFYHCRVTSARNCGSEWSNNTKIEVGAPLKIINLSIDDTICYDTRPRRLEINVTTADASYQWEQSQNGDSNWTNAVGGSGGTSTSYSPPQLTNTTYYRCMVDAGNCGKEPSKPILIYVLDDFKVTTPASQDTSICENRKPNQIRVEASGGQNLTYQWQQRTPPSLSWENITDADTLIYSPPELSKTTHYRCMVKSEYCNIITSDPEIMITVTGIPDVNGIAAKYDKNGRPYMLIYPNPKESFIYQWYEGDELIPNATLQFYYPPNYDNRTLKIGHEYKVSVATERNPDCENYTVEFMPEIKPPGDKPFTITPNPVPDNLFTVFFNRDLLQDGQNYTLCIYSLVGQKIWEQKVNRLDNIAITPNMPTGVYMITLYTDEQQYTEKLLIIK